MGTRGHTAGIRPAIARVLAVVALCLSACTPAAEPAGGPAGTAPNATGDQDATRIPPPHAMGPEDPHHKFLLRASSSDGQHWERIPGVLASMASSPQLTLIDAAMRVYFVRGGNAVATLPFLAQPGDASEKVEISGQDEGLVVDPHVVALPDGGYRLYYLFQSLSQDPGQSPTNTVYSAKGDDGIHWKREGGTRLEGPFVDPDVVALPDGQWRMFTTRNAVDVFSAISPDGLDFTWEPGQRLAGGGVTSTLLADDGWWMYHHLRQRIYVAHSSDGLSFQVVGEPVLSPEPDGADKFGVESPSVLVHDGTWYMVYASTRSPRAAGGPAPTPDAPGDR